MSTPPPLESSPLYAVVRDPLSWFVCAAELAALLPGLAAEITEEFREVGVNLSRPATRLMDATRAFFLLGGYAVENYLKGLCLSRNASKPVDPSLDPFLPSGLSTHNFTALSRQAGLSLTAAQESLLELLERNVTWYARYPVPKQLESFLLFGSQCGKVEPVLALLEHLRTLAASYRPPLPI